MPRSVNIQQGRWFTQPRTHFFGHLCIPVHFTATAAEADFRSDAEAQELGGLLHEALLLQHGPAQQQRLPLAVGRPRIGDLGRGAAGGIAGRNMNF